MSEKKNVPWSPKSLVNQGKQENTIDVRTLGGSDVNGVYHGGVWDFKSEPKAAETFAGVTVCVPFL